MKALKKSAGRIIRPQRLRARAERLLAESPEKISELPPDDARKLLHELQVHQVELEMQNDELRRIQLDLQTSRDRFAELYDSSPVGYVTLDASGVVRQANLTAARLLKTEREPLLAKPLTTFIARESQDTFYLHRQVLFTSRVRQRCEIEMRRADGSNFFAALESIAMSATDGRKRLEWLVSLSDITVSRQKQESRVRDISLLADESPDLILRIDADGILQYANAASAASAASAVLMANAKCELGSLVSAEWREIIRAALQSGTSSRRELISADQTFEVLVTPFRELGYVNLYARNISQRVQARMAAQREKAFSDAIIAGIPGIFYLVNEQGRLLRWNRAYETVTGFSAEKMATLSCLDNVFEDDRDLIAEKMKEAFARGYTEVEAREITKDGARYFFKTGQRLEIDGQIYLVGCGVDITKRKQAEAALSEMELRLASFVTATFEGIVFSEDGRIVDCNEQYARMLGRTLKELRGREITDFALPEDRARIAENTRLERESIIEHIMVRKDGRRIIVESHGRPVAPGNPRRICAVRDVTEHRQREEMLGRVNRILRALSSSSQTLLRATDEVSYMNEVCEVVRDCGHALVWIGLAENDAAKSVRPVASAGSSDGYLEKLSLTWADNKFGGGPTGTAIRNGTPAVCQDLPNDPRFATWRDLVKRQNYASSLALPLKDGAKTFGALNIYSRRANAFSDDEIKLLGELSDTLAHGILTLRETAARKEAETQLRQKLSELAEEIARRREAEEQFRALNAELEERVEARTAEIEATNQALKKSEQELADFFNVSPLGLLLVNPKGRILMANPALLELVGYSAGELIGKPVAHFHIDPEIAGDLLRRLAHGEQIKKHRVRLRQKNGNLLQALIDANGLWENGRLVQTRWFVHDITQSVELEREIVNISERERRRLGQDLHDDLSQQLAGIEFLSSLLAKELAAKFLVKKFADAAREIAQLTQTAMKQTRELARGLSPLGFEAEGGLMDALQELAGRTKKVFQRDCIFRCKPPVHVPDEVVGVHLYRIAQEAIGNAIKHGQAGRIKIKLRAVGNNVILAVEDNGIGFPKLNKRKGMGLRVMQYRAGVIGGSLIVSRNANGGITVVCTVLDGLLPPEKRRRK